MIKHVVLFKFKSFESDKEKQKREGEIRDALLALKDRIAVLKSIDVGLNINPVEEYDLILTTTFDKFEDIGIYAKHPAHLEVVALIKDVKEKRACVDYEA